MEAERGKGRRLRTLLVGAVVEALALLLLLEIYLDLLPFVELNVLLAGRPPEVRSALAAALLVLILAVALRLAGRVFERVTAARIGSQAQARSIWRLVSYLLWAALLIAIVLFFVGDLTAAALSAGIIGGALVIVLQKPLLNAVGWMVITANQTYRIGDRIAIGDARGFVTDIRLTHTVMRELGGLVRGHTFSGRVVIVPNSLIFDQPVFNYTRDVPFLSDEIEVLVTYESDVELAKQYVLEATKEVVGTFMASRYYMYLRRLELRDLEEFVLKQPELRMSFEDSGVSLQVLYFGPIQGRRRIRSEITERIWRRFAADPRVEIAYPHLEMIRHELKRREEARAAEVEEAATTAVPDGADAGKGHSQ